LNAPAFEAVLLHLSQTAGMAHTFTVQTLSTSPRLHIIGHFLDEQKVTFLRRDRTWAIDKLLQNARAA
jgi:hypothetical protein